MVSDVDPDSAQRTPDGRHLIIGGRRWRATDPRIPDNLRQELVNELMSARRAVKAREPDARTRVNDAKVALGERGAPWWEPHEPGVLDPRIAAAMVALLRSRQGTTICPSDVARIVGGERWRTVMVDVRRVADQMVRGGAVRVTQRGDTVVALEAKGPVRIARGESFA